MAPSQVMGSVEGRWVARRRSMEGAHKKIKEAFEVLAMSQVTRWTGGSWQQWKDPSMQVHKAEPHALTTDAEEPNTDVGLEIFSQ